MSESSEEIKHLAKSIIGMCKAVEVIAIGLAAVTVLIITIFLTAAIWHWVLAHWWQVGVIAIANVLIILDSMRE